MSDLTTALKQKFQAMPGLGNGIANRSKNQAVLQWAQEQYDSCRRTRLQFERQWFLNLAFYFGKQYYQWTSELGPIARLIEPPAPPWRVRAISNKIKPIARSEHAKLNKERPIPYVIPSTTDDADLQAAKAGEIILEHLTRERKLSKVIRRATFWQILTGNGFIKDWWDASAKDEGNNQGIIRWEPVTPFHLYVPSMLEEELENQPYVIHSVPKSPWYIKKVFGVELEPQVSTNPTESVMHKVYQALGMQQDSSEVIHVNEMTVKEGKFFPNGGRIFWAQDQVLHIEEGWPFPYEDYPFTHLSHVLTGRFYSDSVIPDLVPLQKEYNRTKSQIIEAKNLMAKPQLKAVQGSLDPKKMTSEPGLIIFYRPGFDGPEPIPLQALPSYVMDSLEIVQRDMDDISSQHEVTKGRTPPGVTAATAIAYLQEEDDSKLAASIASLEEGVEKVGSHTLKLVKRYWTEERVVRVAGDERVYEANQFKGADLRDNTSVTVETGSAAPRSKAAKQAFIMELGKMGWIPPDKALRYLDMAESGALYRDMQLDVIHAQRENIKMLQDWEELYDIFQDEDTGEPMGTLEVNTWDNHQTHIMEHNNFRKRQAYEMLDEKAHEVFERHVQMHMQLSGMQFGTNIDSGDVLPAELDPGVPEMPLGAGQNMEEQPGQPTFPPELTELPPNGGPTQGSGEFAEEEGAAE